MRSKTRAVLAGMVPMPFGALYIGQEFTDGRGTYRERWWLIDAFGRRRWSVRPGALRGHLRRRPRLWCADRFCPGAAP